MVFSWKSAKFNLIGNSLYCLLQGVAHEIYRKPWGVDARSVVYYGESKLPELFTMRSHCYFGGVDHENLNRLLVFKGTLTWNGHSLQFQNFWPKSLSFVQKMIFDNNKNNFFFYRRLKSSSKSKLWVDRTIFLLK